MRGINDTYRVTAASGARYAAKLSRINWRSKENILYELSLLESLASSGAQVPRPIRGRNAEPYFPVDAPEGRRLLTLYTWLDGVNQRSLPDIRGAREFGRQLALIHRVSSDFELQSRQSLDIVSDLETYAPCLDPVLYDRPLDGAFVAEQIPRIIEELHAIGSQARWGICHGDVHPGNAVQRDESVGVLDFDVCGEWFQCFDVASYVWSIRLFAWQSDYSRAFVDGYLECGDLSGEELMHFPLLILARDAWHLVTWARNTEALGCLWFHDHELDRRMRLFRDFVSMGLP